MDELIALNETFLEQINTIIEYIGKLVNTDKGYYRFYQEIIYVGVVNRTYSLWETFSKDLVFCYYELIKEQLIKDGKLVQKLKLNELPGYIVEEGIIHDNYIYYELKKEFVTYSTKNIGINELKNLFARFDVDVDTLYSNREIIEYLKENAEAFDIQEENQEILKTAMSRLINERNLVSHSASIENYQSLETIKTWAHFFTLLANELTFLICKKFVNQDGMCLDNIGKIVKFYKKSQVLCIDIADCITINSRSLLIVKRNEQIKYLLKPISFMVNDVEKEYVQSKDPAGIKLRPLFRDKADIKDTDNIMLLENVF